MFRAFSAFETHLYRSSFETSIALFIHNYECTHISLIYNYCDPSQICKKIHFFRHNMPFSHLPYSPPLGRLIQMIIIVNMFKNDSPHNVFHLKKKKKNLNCRPALKVEHICMITKALMSMSNNVMLNCNEKILTRKVECIVLYCVLCLL